MADQKPAEGEQAPPQGETQANQEATTPTTDSGHVESEEVSTSTPDSGHVEQKSDEAKRREEGKLQQVQREYKATQARLQNLIGFVSKNPKRLKKAYMETGGYTEEQADAKVKEVHPDWQGGTQQTQVQQDTSQQQTPQQPALNPWQQAALGRLEREEQIRTAQLGEIVDNFVQKYPDLDPRTREVIGAEADRLIEDKGMPLKEALEEARIKITEPESYKKQGEVEGMSKAYSAIGASGSGASGGSTGKKTQTNISAQDEEIINKLGLGKEERESFEKFALE